MMVHCSMSVVASLVFTVAATVFCGDMANGAPVEKFLGEWCARQYPTQLSSGTDRERSVPIEPFCGQWCFLQYPDELSSLDKSEAIGNLYANHQKIEHQLSDRISEWGEDTGATAKVPVEQYIGRWCVSQWPDKFGPSFDPNVSISTKEVPIEGPWGEWCFESFPNALAPLDRNTEILALYKSHKRVEEEVLQWYRDTQHTEA